jgi:apolipoprotein N-acyltransferase
VTLTTHPVCAEIVNEWELDILSFLRLRRCFTFTSTNGATAYIKHVKSKTEELREKPISVSLCPPQVPHRLTWASAVRNRRLTTELFTILQVVTNVSEEHTAFIFCYSALKIDHHNLNSHLQDADSCFQTACTLIVSHFSSEIVNCALLQAP